MIVYKPLSLNYSLNFDGIRISWDSHKMDIGQAGKAKPLQRCLSFPPFSPKISGAVSILHLRMFFPAFPGRFLCSAFDHVFRSAASARHGPHGSSQSPAAVFARQVIQLSNFKPLHIPPFVKGKKKGFWGGVISIFFVSSNRILCSAFAHHVMVSPSLTCKG